MQGSRVVVTRQPITGSMLGVKALIGRLGAIVRPTFLNRAAPTNQKATDRLIEREGEALLAKNPRPTRSASDGPSGLTTSRTTVRRKKRAFGYRNALSSGFDPPMPLLH